MTIFDIVLITATTLCSLVAGFLFCYAVVIMPGISRLDDAMFLKTFQVTDRIIQDNQPLFILVWLGSIVALVLCATLGFTRLQGLPLALLIIATAIYLIGVQLSTIKFHLPLNNRLQKLDIELMDPTELRLVRNEFERPWNRSNRRRTVVAFLSSALLITLAIIQ